MLHSSQAVAAAEVRRTLARMARAPGEFDASRYFRAAVDLGFYNVGTPRMRALAKSIYDAHRDKWSVDDAVAFAGELIRDRYLEVKSVGIEVVARYRRQLAPRLLATFKRWLSDGHSANWATTDAICGFLIGPLVCAHPGLAPRIASWTRDRSLWVRRAAAVGLIASVRTGAALDIAYRVARDLHPDREDLIQKAVGWLLREAGKADARRLEQYLRDNGPAIPRTTVRYAIERFPTSTRRRLLRETSPAAAGRSTMASRTRLRKRTL